MGSGTTITSSSIATADVTVFAQWVEIVTQEWNYSYTGAYATFPVPYTGEYKIELWGAQGKNSGGKGAYVYGEISLVEDDLLYVYVGGQSKWNGGGSSGNSSRYGGDASDIRLVQGNLYSRIMVAGGGGGKGASNGGNGGLLNGSTGATHDASSTHCEEGNTILVVSGGIGGKQVAQTGSSFGQGAAGCQAGISYSGAGGGGYWGGGTGSCTIRQGECHEDTSIDATATSWPGAGGGSSYISGVTGYVAVSANGSTTPRNDSNNTQCTQTSAASDNTCSIHYSGKTFSNAGGSAGNRSGTGQAKITLISSP